MVRSLVLVLLAACVAEPQESTIAAPASIAFTREHVTADIYHYEAVIPVGSSPNAKVRVHRVVRELAPFVPRKTKTAVMMLHGDFSTFETNFAPSLGTPASPVLGVAPYFAARDIDVWGVDRRWTLPAKLDDISDFGTMGVAQEVDDVRMALVLARGIRVVTGGDGGKIALAGFSHGGQLAYSVAGLEGGKPPSQRNVDALVVFDWYGALEDETMRADACFFAGLEYEGVAAGDIDVPNQFQINVGTRALAAPNDPSPAPAFAGLTNREALVLFLGQTYVFAAFAPFYHLAAPILDGEAAIGLAEMTEAAGASWLAGATPHESLLEAADFDQILCGDAPQPVDAPLSAIHVPLYYLGAGGGIGDLGLFATTQTASTDVTTRVWTRGGDRAADIGHTDLLLATDAPAQVWQPLATWLLHH